jgi:hypothetical protein
MSGNKKILELEIATDLTGASFVIAKTDVNERVPTASMTNLLGIDDLEDDVAALQAFVNDGDRGDIVVGSSGTTWTIDPTVLSAFGRTLIDDATAGAALTTLGVSAFAQTLLDDAAAADVLTTLGVSAFIQTLLDDADVGTAQTTLGISTFVKTLLDDADATAARATLGLVIGTNVQAFDADLATIAGLTATTDNFIVSVASAWASRTPAQVRTTLGLVIGTNVQAWDALLDAIAALTTAAGGFIRTTGANTVVAQAIVGTVSQSAGTPTGAIVERGTNANGEYTRFADGTQICSHSFVTDATNEQVWTFPAAFSASPQTTANVAGSSSTSLQGVKISSISATTAGFRVTSITSGSSTVSQIAATIRMIAVGTWF